MNRKFRNSLPGKSSSAVLQFCRSAVRSLPLVLATSLVLAGGPIAVAPDHLPVRWDPPLVGYVIDNGKLGTLTRDQGAAKVRSAFKTWQDVDTSAISFQDKGFLSVDVNSSNFEQYINAKRSEGNVIIFDDNGSITNDLFGADSTDILGFADAVSNGHKFDFAYAVLNGPNSSDIYFFGTMVHEFGHLIGLDHTQAGHARAFNTLFNDNKTVPVMYPYLLPGGTQKPLRDDIAWISWLYPDGGFAQNTGTITGKVFHPPGTPLPGANVVAMPVTTSGGAIAELALDDVSVVSDFLMKGDGSYLIPGLPPGNYVVFIEPIFGDFIQGSSVGPFDYRFSNFFKDYYNGTAESDHDNPDDKTALSVAAAGTVNTIDLVANEIVNRLDLLTDDSEMLFRFPEGFTFPFYGKTYTEVFVNSDGNLTFGKGDGIPGLPRDVQRFLGGPPRIAPLFTDLNPSDAGEIISLTGPGEVTFVWNNVPEFADTGNPQGNIFSVTLYSTGDISFHFEQVHVTPDAEPDFPTGLQAITGVTPGGLTSGTTVDLSATGPSITLGSNSVYEVFAGNSFDLAGRDIFFLASPQSELWFPFYTGNASDFSGYAITNYSDEAALLQFLAYGPDGNLLDFPGNPHTETVDPQTQMARLGTELFNVGISTPQSGWIRILSNTAKLASFFEVGNGLNGPLTKMDGSVAITAQSKTLFFSRIYDGLAVFPSFAGPLDAETRVSIANPNADAIKVRFNFYSPSGTPAATQVEKTILGHGVLVDRVSTLMSTDQPLDDGFLKAEVIQGQGAVGFEMIQVGDTLLGLNASYGNPNNSAFSAQLAAGTAAGVDVFTSLKIVNTSTNDSRAFTVTAYGANGSELSIPLANVILAPNQTFQRDVTEMFGFPPIGPETVGSIAVQVDGPGLIGDVVFGNPNNGEYAAALPLQTVLFTKAIFSQVANGSINPADPSMDTFTGIALFNPGSQAAQVTLKVFDRNGVQVGATKTIALPARNRMSDLIENLVSGTSTLIQGYISVESNVPLVAQQLFGNATLKFLSAVPPQVIE